MSNMDEKNNVAPQSGEGEVKNTKSDAHTAHHAEHHATHNTAHSDSVSAKKKTVAKKNKGFELSNVIAREHQKAKKIKISRHDLKKDDFKELTGKAMDYLNAHSNKVLAIVGSVAALFLIIVLVNLYSGSKKEKASELFTKARNMYDAAMSETPPSISTLKGSLEMFESLVNTHKTGTEAVIGYLYEGNIHFNLQDYDKAIEAYNKFLSSEVKNKTYETIVKTNLAYCYENKNELEKAIESFKELSNSTSGFNKESSLFELGLLYEKAGKTDEAIKNYQEFVKNYPTSTFMVKVQERINSIQAK